MATPHVTGLAVLIKGQNLALTNMEIKTAIKNSVDLNASLIGRVATGGRINTNNALILPRPSSLPATVGSTEQIDLRWTDNSPNEMGFEIERRFRPKEVYAQLTIVGANVTSCCDMDLGDATTFYYRVRAYNVAWCSSYSNEAKVTMPLSGAGGGNGGCFIATSVVLFNGRNQIDPGRSNLKE